MILTAFLLFAAAADHGFGLLPPTPLPDVMVTTEDNRQIRLRSLASGRAVAVQFVFTDCVTVCPLLGSLFHSVAKRLHSDSKVLLLSISVNPERDTPERLKEWLAGFGQVARWNAIRTSLEELQQLLTAFGQKAGAPAAHSSQVFFVKSDGVVFGRTTGLPDSAGVVDILQRLP